MEMSGINCIYISPVISEKILIVVNEPHGSDDENYDDIINYLPFFVLLLFFVWFFR